MTQPAKRGPSNTLPQKVYLLAYDSRRQRVGSSLELGYALRAAALLDLQLRGQLSDLNGRVQATASPRAIDPVLDGVRQQVARTGGKSWRHWVRTDHRGIVREVRDQVHDLGLIEVSKYRRFGILPATKVTVPDLQPVLRFTNTALQALRGDAGSDTDDAALLVLAATAGLPAVAVDLRPDRNRISRLAAAYGPVIPALRSVIRGMRAASSGGS